MNEEDGSTRREVENILDEFGLMDMLRSPTADALRSGRAEPVPPETESATLSLSARQG